MDVHALAFELAIVFHELTVTDHVAPRLVAVDAVQHVTQVLQSTSGVLVGYNPHGAPPW